MGLALEAGRAAAAAGNVPVGAVVLLGDRVLATRHNERRQTGDPTAHAEVLALRDAAGALDTWHLDDTTLVTTLEPCLMCAGAAVVARVRRVVFGAFDPKAGAAGSLYNVLVDPRLNHQCDVAGGIRAEECGELLSRFFADRRS
ncbi:MAG TPA: tRNA-specific adenosine deaminase [Acidimicrobiaceae bacterium]|nr:tRNA-specific adenosine deaminase [Acidimicrobiaceae bacterium]